MIAVLGATGTSGSAVVRALRAAGTKVRAVVRAPARARKTLGAGVEIKAGDLDRPATLVAALRGVTRAFFVSAMDERYPARVAGFLAAARAAGVAHVVKLGAMEADLASPSGLLRQHAETDALVRACGADWTLLQSNGFFQNLLWSAGSIRDTGRLVMPTGKGRQAVVDARDVAAVAAAVLTGRGHAGRIYELTGPEALTYAEIAAVFTRVLETPVVHVDPPLAKVRAGLAASGLPAWNAEEIANLYGVIATGALGRTTDTVRRALRRAPTSLEAWVREHAAAFRPAASARSARTRTPRPPRTRAR